MTGSHDDHSAQPKPNGTGETKIPPFPAWLLSKVPHDGHVVAQALLQYQLFPNVKEPGQELPPFFTSATFTEDVAEKLANLKATKKNKNQRASYVSFRTRRYDGLVRRLGLPHPVPYSRLVIHLRDNWPGICQRLDSQESMIKPTWYGADGRMIAMDYGSSREKTMRETRSAQGHQYVARADISNCFPSLYTHSIDWALRGITTAKNNRHGINKRTWEECLDTFVQNCHNGETKGVMIGPAVSNILSELVLQRIDEQLRKRHVFVRYIDDYTAYFDTREQAEAFIADLDRALTTFRLVLNTKKTRVKSLRHGFGERWINEVHSYLPKSSGGVASVRFLQQCEMLAQQHPDQSVLLYGVKTLLSKRKCPLLGEVSTQVATLSRDVPVLDELIRINYFHPHLSCFVARQLAFVGELLKPADKDRLATLLRDQMIKAVPRNETDTVLWLLYCIRVLLRRRIINADVRALVSMNDDLVWVALAATSKTAKRYVVEALRNLNSQDPTQCQEHWLSRYELHRDGVLPTSDINMDSEQEWFEKAESMDVRFSVLGAPLVRRKGVSQWRLPDNQKPF